MIGRLEVSRCAGTDKGGTNGTKHLTFGVFSLAHARGVYRDLAVGAVYRVFCTNDSTNGGIITDIFNLTFAVNYVII